MCTSKNHDTTQNEENAYVDSTTYQTWEYTQSISSEITSSSSSTESDVSDSNGKYTTTTTSAYSTQASTNGISASTVSTSTTITTTVIASSTSSTSSSVYQEVSGIGIHISTTTAKEVTSQRTNTKQIIIPNP